MKKGINMNDMLGKKLNKNMVELESVGCVLDTKTKVTFPIYNDGTYDDNCPCHLDDIENDEWYDTLSIDDMEIVVGVA